MRIRTPKKRITISSGALRTYAEGAKLKISAHGKSALVTLPCTLSVLTGEAMWDVGDKQYRGKIILTKAKNGTINCINYLPVESYLRGVVPLEIGPRGERDREAMKAQAIAARTYTYKKIEANRYPDYDMLSTVSDQVYGGAAAEYLLTDRAIEKTAGQVMFYRDELVDAFYHSTCGGRTAAVHEVWSGSPKGYLKSRRDNKRDGSSYCAISSVYTWKESWSASRFSAIIQKYSKSMRNIAAIKGRLKGVSVVERTISGRVKKVKITTTKGAYYYGGDKIRFLFRRDRKGEPILRSAFFTIALKGGTVVANGRGYGHGIGMCQMGALGRARSGQGYQTILKAYYSGVAIQPIGDFNGSEK